MTKKILSILLAIVMMFGCLCTFAFADTTSITVNTNAENSISLKSGEIKTFTLSMSGSYTILTTGSKKAQVKIVTTSNSTVSYTALSKADNGNVFDTRTYGASVLGIINFGATDYTFEVSASDGSACSFKLWILDYNTSYSGFTSTPTTTTTYQEDVDFTASNGTVTFKNGPDFTGAVFSFNDDNNNPIYTLKDADVINVLSSPVYTYSLGTITYTAIPSVGSGRSTITFKAKPNYIKSAVISNVADTSFTFGQDGTIKGNLFSYYYRPDVDLTGATVTVTYKDYLGADPETLTVEKDSNGYYVTCTYGGTQYITNNSSISSSASGTVNASFYVGNCATTIPLTITKANFIQMIIIWFGLLLGNYS